MPVSCTVPLTAEEARFGYRVPEEVQKRMQQYYLLQNGQQLIVTQAMSYAKGYQQAANPTVRQVRDVWMVSALTWLVRCLQGKTPELNELTNAAKLWYRHNSVPDIWPDRDALEKGQYGLPGSLAYNLFLEPPGRYLNAVELIELVLNKFYETTSISLNLNPRLRQHKLLDELLVYQFAYWQEALDTLYLETPTPGTKHLHKYLRGSFLTPTDWEGLPIRALLGELDESLIILLDMLYSYFYTNPSYASAYNLSWPLSRPGELIQQIHELFPPAGLPMVYAALIVESYLNAFVLVSQDESLLDMSYADLLSSQQYANVKFTLAANLCTALDSYEILQRFKTYSDITTHSQPLLLQVQNLLPSGTKLTTSEPERLTHLLWQTPDAASALPTFPRYVHPVVSVDLQQEPLVNAYSAWFNATNNKQVASVSHANANFASALNLFFLQPFNNPAPVFKSFADKYSRVFQDLKLVGFQIPGVNAIHSGGSFVIQAPGMAMSLSVHAQGYLCLQVLNPISGKPLQATIKLVLNKLLATPLTIWYANPIEQNFTQLGLLDQEVQIASPVGYGVLILRPALSAVPIQEYLG